MRYSKYPSYKESGVEWLGEIPEHWDSTYLKYIANINMGQSPSSTTYNNEGFGIAFLQGNADFGNIYPTARTFTTEAKKMSQIDDILFTVRAPVGAMNISNQSYAIGRGLCAISSTKYSKKSFLWWLMPVVKMELNTVATGSTYEAVSVEQVNNSTISLPSLDEQQAIANYLDKATDKIDTLISKQTKLIELLKEKRQAVISSAVTRGLDSTVAMKDSGIEWLGEIPEHWEIKKLRYIIQGIESGTSVNASSQPATASEYGILKTSCVYTENFRYEENKTVVESEKDRVSCPLKVNTLIVSRMNTPDLVGAAGLVEEAPSNIFLPDRLWQVSFTNTNPKFIHYLTLTNTYRGYIHTVCAGTSSSMQNLSQDDFKDFSTALPAIEEQKDIADYIDDKTSKIDTLINKATKAIDLLKEKRTALISAVVTGKIDVREIA